MSCGILCKCKRVAFAIREGIDLRRNTGNYTFNYNSSTCRICWLRPRMSLD